MIPGPDNPTTPVANLAPTTSSRTLSSHALAALAEFQAEKDDHRKRFEKLRDVPGDDGGEIDALVDEPLSMAAFAEDWNESQFWVR